MDERELERAVEDSHKRMSAFNVEARERFPFLGCAFECADGWRALIEAMLEGIAPLVAGTDYRIVQVKEKFGELRVYDQGAHVDVAARVDAVVEEAVAKSNVTCEISGEPGQMCNDRGYVCVRAPAYRRPGAKVVGANRFADIG